MEKAQCTPPQNYPVSYIACDITYNQELIFFYFNRMRSQGMHLFLDTPILCPYNSQKDACGIKNNVKWI